MQRLKIIFPVPQLDAAACAERLDHCGADGLIYYCRKTDGDISDKDIKTIKEINRSSQVPLLAVGCLHRFEDAKKMIYAGAKTVIVPQYGFEPDAVREAAGRFGSDRIFLMTEPGKEGCGPDRPGEIRDLLSQYDFGGVYLGGDPYTSSYRECARSLSKDPSLPLYIRDESPDIDRLADLCQSTGPDGVILDYEDFAEPMAIKQKLNQRGLFVNLFESALSFEDFKLNADGMIPCITQDYRSGEVLMLAYMTKESYEKTLETGRMTYYSRSRQALWTKGETSGHYQYVRSLSIDCDRDTILAKVAQIGPACHTGSRSCFYTGLVKRETDAHNPLEVFEQVYSTILDRKDNPKEGSYTNYLFDKGIDKILKKVGEEAAEIVIAAKNPDSEELKYEICDFLYHMMVLMAEKDVSWEEVTGELARRH